MKRQILTPAAYHSLAFDPKLLPNLETAGPVSASILCNARDPLNFLFGAPRKASKAMEWGNLVDMLWLTPELFNTTYIVLPADAPAKPTAAMLSAAKPGQASLDRQAWWTAWERKSAGLIPVKAATMAEAESAVSMLRQHKLASYIRDSSEAQVALTGSNPLGYPGQAKCLIDLLPTSGRFHGSVVDLKSTFDTTDRALATTIWRFEYHLKEAWYGLLLEAAGLGPINQHIHIWQRSKFPYDVHVREMCPVDIEVGTTLIHKRLRAMQMMDPQDVSALFDENLSTIELQPWQREQEPGVMDEEEESTDEN